MARVTVEEASGFYYGAMHNTLPAGPGVCSACRTFTDPGYDRCYRCFQHTETLDVIVPITYSVDLGQMHKALRGYKDGYGHAEVTRARTGLAAILWRFLDLHEECIALSAGVDQFEIVTTVPSTTPARDEKNALRLIAGWCEPISSRLERVLVPTGNAPSTHTIAYDRYEAIGDFGGANVLLVDDTWTTGAHARSAGFTLKEAGASKIALVAIGRHINPDWNVQGTTSGELVANLPPFEWDRCCLDPTGDRGS